METFSRLDSHVISQFIVALAFNGQSSVSRVYLSLSFPALRSRIRDHPQTLPFTLSARPSGKHFGIMWAGAYFVTQLE